MSSEANSQLKNGPKSLLSPSQHVWLLTALAMSAFLLANTFFLVFIRLASMLPEPWNSRLAYDQDSIPKLFQFMVLSHTGMGYVVIALFIAFALWHLPSVWRRRRSFMVASGGLLIVFGAGLWYTGRFIIQESASENNRWAWWTHLILGVLAPLAYLVHRRWSYVRVQNRQVGRYFGLTGGAFALVLVMHGLSNRGMEKTDEARLAAERGSYTGPGSRIGREADMAVNPFVSVSYVPPGSPFFPSAATTTTGDYLPHRIITRGDTATSSALSDDLDTYGFVHRQTIGAETCARCHPDVVEQWSASAHRFASFNNPFYEASITDMRKNAKSLTEGVREHIDTFTPVGERTGEIKSKWCSGCHDPALMLAGIMDDNIDRRSAQAQAGLTCLACHAIDKIHNPTGNGNYNIADEQMDPYLFPNARTGTYLATLHDSAVKAKPEAHRRQMLKPFHRTAEFCGTCHKVSLPQPVNDYRWLRGQNEYDNWHDSGVALNASRTFYLPPVKKLCQDCHMPLEEAPLGDVAAKEGKVRSHRFLAVNTALPFLRGDTETIERMEVFLRDEKLRIDVFAMQTQADGGTRNTIMALDKNRPTLQPGQAATFDVVVRNKGVGHTFPGGTNDSNESWIEFTMLDEEGRILFRSGAVGEDGYVDPAAHYFRALMVDRHSQVIRRRNAQDIYAPVYANVIGPGTAHAVHYGVTVPDAPGKKVTLRARLMWRKFDRGFTEFAYRTNPEGFKKFYDVPDLPITEICRDEVTLTIADPNGRTPSTAAAPDALPSQWLRYNDYGIGLLLQGDTLGAARAFGEVKRLQPGFIDGPRNLARVAIQDGDLTAAFTHLADCEKLAPGDPQTAWFWGVALQEAGRYTEAVQAYRRVLDKFPEDRAAWRSLGRIYYLDNHFEDSIAAMHQVLKIDPEDRVAYYHLMLAHRALAQEPEALAAEEAYERYKVDENAEAVTHAYRLTHPHDNHESLAIHVHKLRAVANDSTGEESFAQCEASQSALR